MVNYRMVLLGSCAAALFSHAPAFAQEQSTRAMDVAAGPATRSIAELARQADIQILAPQADLAGAQTNAVQGRMKPREALDRLLAGTALKVNSDTGRFITVRRMNEVRPGVQKISTVGQVGESGVVSGMAPQQSAGAGPVQDEVDAVVVTGSLISQRNYVSASPIVVQSAEAVKQSGNINLEGALNQLPGFVPSSGATGGTQGTGGHAVLNLHGLGSNRNLVLLDGRRLPLADNTGSVDINFIPDSIVSGIEVITGGASAVYGSDAMSGVVNFRSINFFEGIRVDGQYGASFSGDAAKTSLSGAMGAATGDGRGRIILNLGYNKRGGLFGRDREYFYYFTPSSFLGTGTFVPSATNLASQTATNALFARYGVTGTTPNTLQLGFNDDGTLYNLTGARNYKGPTDPYSSGYALIAGNVRMPAILQQQIINPQERKSLYSKFDYKLTDDLTAYGQLLYVDSDTYTNTGGSLTQYGAIPTIPVSNPFIPGDLRTLLASRPNPNAPFVLNTRYVGIPYKAFNEQYNVAQYLAGLRGSLPIKDWTWDGYVAYDSTRHNQTMHDAVLKDRVQTLLNAADGGNAICAGGFNPFGDTNARKLSQACVNYLTASPQSTERLSQSQAQLVVQGSLFDLPAGAVALAVQGSYRRNTYDFTPDANLASQNVESILATAAASGKIAVKELATQIDVPVLRDLPFARQLNLGAAFRISDYTTSGSVQSYEGDFKWRPVQSVLLRGGYQRAVRAPNIGELFSAPAGSPLQFGTPPTNIGDPCDVRSIARRSATGPGVRALCLAQGIPAAVVDTYTFPTTNSAGLIQGNLNLTPETADTYNVGLVWNSDLSHPLLRKLSVSVDYYTINIKNAISVVPGLTILSKCYNQDGTNPSYSNATDFCRLIHRDASGLMDFVETPYLNLGGFKTSGVEFQVNWTAAMDDLGLGSFGDEITINSAIGYSDEFKVQTLPGAKFDEFAGTNTPGKTFPRWKALTTFGYKNGPFSAGLRWRYQDAMKDVAIITTPSTPGRGVGAYHLFDFFGVYDLNDAVQLRAGVTNLTERGLPFVSSATNGTDPAVFDAIGRSFYLGFKLKM